MSKRDFKYEFRKHARKVQCPNCEQRTFTPYVYAGTDEVVNDNLFGRCDRENNCGYYLYPTKDYNRSDYIPVPRQEPPTDYIPQDWLDRTMSHFEMQTLYRYFYDRLDDYELSKAWKRYNVGTYGDASIWWQVDIEGRVRTGKIMQYLPNGHRNKCNFGTWVHKKYSEEFNLKQCLFGEHLITDGCKVAVCESEKTAVIMSILAPQFVWLATGGSKNVQPHKFQPLIERHCLITFFPDKGVLKEWQNRCGNIGNYDYMIENSDLPDGSDILDYWEYYGHL